MGTYIVPLFMSVHQYLHLNGTLVHGLALTLSLLRSTHVDASLRPLYLLQSSNLDSPWHLAWSLPFLWFPSASQMFRIVTTDHLELDLTMWSKFPLGLLLNTIEYSNRSRLVRCGAGCTYQPGI